MTTLTSPARSCDAADLVIAHQAFRRVYSLAPDAVRSTDPTDRARVASVASTLKAVNAALHHHHTVEDAMPVSYTHLMDDTAGELVGTATSSRSRTWRSAPMTSSRSSPS